MEEIIRTINSYTKSEPKVYGDWYLWSYRKQSYITIKSKYEFYAENDEDIILDSIETNTIILPIL